MCLVAENPFAPPSSLDLPTQQERAFEVMATVAESWHAVIGDFGVVIMAFMMFFSLALASIATGVGVFLAFPVLVWGFTKLVLNLKDGIAGYTDIGEGFRRYGTRLGRTLLLFVLYALVFIPPVLVSTASGALGGKALSFAGQTVALLLALVLSSRFLFAPFFLVDQDLGAIDAMKASWQHTSHQTIRTLLLILLSGLIATIGCAFVIGGIVTVPMALVMYAAAYRQMFPMEKYSAPGV